MSWLRLPLAYLATVLVMAVMATIAQSQFVIGALADVGAQIGTSDRIAMTLADLTGLAPLYGLFIAIGFLIAFLAAGLVVRFTPLPSILVMPVAGAVAMLVMLILMERVFFGVQVIAGARTLPGLLVQVGLGLLSGWLFARWTQRGK